MGEQNGEEVGYLFPQIPEDTKREPFSFVEWERFAVTEEEKALIERLLSNPEARNRYAELYEKGQKVRDEQGNVVVQELNPLEVIGVRYDGLSFLINCLAQGQCPPDPRSMDRSLRKKTPGKGILFTALIDAEVNTRAQIVTTSEISPEELEKRVVKTTGFYSDSAILEAINPLLLTEAKSNELNLTLLSHTLRGTESLVPYAEWFASEGDQLWNYLRRVRSERGSILWGVNRRVAKDPNFIFGYGDFYSLNEIDVRNRQGVIPSSEFTFLATKPGALEDKIGQVC